MFTPFVTSFKFIPHLNMYRKIFKKDIPMNPNKFFINNNNGKNIKPRDNCKMSSKKFYLKK
jgi:hypothetical protein